MLHLQLKPSDNGFMVIERQIDPPGDLFPGEIVPLEMGASLSRGKTLPPGESHPLAFPD